MRLRSRSVISPLRGISAIPSIHIPSPSRALEALNVTVELRLNSTGSERHTSRGIHRHPWAAGDQRCRAAMAGISAPAKEVEAIPIFERGGAASATNPGSKGCARKIPVW